MRTNTKCLQIGAIVLALVMMVTLAACGGSGQQTGGNEANTPAADGAADGATDAQPATDGAYPSYTFAHNLWGAGAYPLEIIAKEARAQAAYFGNELDVADNSFTLDKGVTDLQAQLAKGVDGVQYFSVAPTLFETVDSLCTGANTPYVLYDKIPEDQAVIDMIRSNPLFIGAISAEEYTAGVGIAEIALADGMSKAILVRAAPGDYSHDERERGFRDTFTAGGGEILGVANCTDPSEAVTKSNDIITAYPEADCLYGLGGDFITGAINAIQSRNDASSELRLYATDLSPDLAQAMLDGNLHGVNGGQWVCGALSNTLLINYLDGHQILDDNGNTPWLDHLPMMVLTPDKAEAFITLMENNGSPVSEEEYKNLTYRYNPDVTYQDYYDFIANFENVFLEKLS